MKDKCKHSRTSIRYGRDGGGGMERTEPRSWRYKTCDGCGAVTHRERQITEWVEVPTGTKSGSYGIEYPDGRVY